MPVMLTKLKPSLLGIRTEIVAEISAYPTPIPACDAQFNELLAQRRHIAKALRLIDVLSLQSETDPKHSETFEALLMALQRIDKNLYRSAVDCNEAD